MEGQPIDVVFMVIAYFGVGGLVSFISLWLSGDVIDGTFFWAMLVGLLWPLTVSICLWITVALMVCACMDLLRRPNPPETP